MDNKETLKTLHNYQCWRRGKDMEPPSPKDIGVAIDNAIRLLRKENRYRSSLKEHIASYAKDMKDRGIKPPYKMCIDSNNFEFISRIIRREFKTEQEMIEFLEQNNIEI